MRKILAIAIAMSMSVSSVGFAQRAATMDYYNATAEQVAALRATIAEEQRLIEQAERDWKKAAGKAGLAIAVSAGLLYLLSKGYRDPNAAPTGAPEVATRWTAKASDKAKGAVNSVKNFFKGGAATAAEGEAGTTAATAGSDLAAGASETLAAGEAKAAEKAGQVAANLADKSSANLGEAAARTGSEAAETAAGKMAESSQAAKTAVEAAGQGADKAKAGVYAQETPAGTAAAEGTTTASSEAGATTGEAGAAGAEQTGEAAAGPGRFAKAKDTLISVVPKGRDLAMLAPGIIGATGIYYLGIERLSELGDQIKRTKASLAATQQDLRYLEMYLRFMQTR